MSTVPPLDRVADLERQLAKLRGIPLLVGSLAHDFNNLLTAISGHAALLETDAEPGGESHESATAILQAAEHASVIAAKLQGIANRSQTRSAPVNLHDTISEIALLMKPIAGDGVEIRQQLEAEYPTILGDSEQIHQALLNLTLNAAEAMEGQGLLSLGATGSETAQPNGALLREIIVTVSDTGKGIPEENLDRIFEPFFTTSETGAGSGLGLSVVAGIVRKHNGRIDVKSAEGQGTTFRLHFPALGDAA